ncbi:hypothetical protein [Streptomyces monashensis]|uniref:Uncharacterized protein n=1 Tax=Streptomyces monashensis TaxID=1678012 RepID=A0A1S2QB72_9ACTN|nr:hypothetical protein [Streptomyces monashensis]OIK02776.1 hypothetical protein BIV23_24490 [Streptomyces monashensis]
MSTARGLVMYRMYDCRPGADLDRGLAETTVVSIAEQAGAGVARVDALLRERPRDEPAVRDDRRAVKARLAPSTTRPDTCTRPARPPRGGRRPAPAAAVRRCCSAADPAHGRRLP